MRSPRIIGLGLWGVLVPLLGSLGCTISITPAWHMPVSSPAPGSYSNPGPPIPITGMPNSNLPPGAVPPNGGYPPGGPYPNGPYPPQPLPPITSRAGENVSLLMERLQGAEESRQALAGRLLAVESALREKDQAVQQTSHEVQESTKQMRRTREELLRLKQELDDSREKNRATYREYKNTLDAFLKALEDNVDSGKSTPNYRGVGPSQIGEPPGR